MASVTLAGVGKVYPGGERAVHDLSLEIADGEFMVLVGPSGCGKTTALRMIAGLEEITEGEIRIGETVVNMLEPRKRDIAMVFQNYALYPHMSVYENIAFPLQSRGTPKKEAKELVERTAELLGLTEMLQRRPRTLSGGQRQRVAMGRAIVRQPQVFLMDEPLSNLDAKLRMQMRAEISHLQRKLGATTIYVTHDQVEALTMGTRIAVMRKGVLQQEGPPQELYDRPVNLFAATFIGAPPMNLFRARLQQTADGLHCDIGDRHVLLPASVGAARLGLAGHDGREVAVGIRPEHLADAALRDGGVRIEGDVTLVEALGSDRLVHFTIVADPVLTEDVLEVARDTDAAVAQSLQAEADERRVPLVARFAPESRAASGEPVHVTLDVKHLHFFSLETGSAIY